MKKELNKLGPVLDLDIVDTNNLQDTILQLRDAFCFGQDYSQLFQILAINNKKFIYFSIQDIISKDISYLINKIQSSDIDIVTIEPFYDNQLIPSQMELIQEFKKLGIGFIIANNADTIASIEDFSKKIIRENSAKNRLKLKSFEDLETLFYYQISGGNKGFSLNPSQNGDKCNLSTLFKGTISPIVGQMRRRNIVDYYSFSPYYKSELELLKQCLKTKTPIRYHACDINSKTSESKKDFIGAELEKISPKRKETITYIQSHYIQLDDIKFTNNCAVNLFGFGLKYKDNFLQKITNKLAEDCIIIQDINIHNTYLDANFNFKIDIQSNLRHLIFKTLNKICPELKEHQGKWQITYKCILNSDNCLEIQFFIDVTKDFGFELNCNPVYLVKGAQILFGRFQFNNINYYKKIFDKYTLNELISSHNKDFNTIISISSKKNKIKTPKTFTKTKNTRLH